MPQASKYTYACFCYKLKKIRNAFGYTQEEAGELLGISKSQWCAWEKNVRIPDMKQVIALARAFNVDLNYFFIPDIDPPAFRGQEKNLQPLPAPDPANNEILHKFPFAETNMAKGIFRKLTELLLVKGLAFFHVFPHSGITTLLQEFCNREPDSLLMINHKSYHDIDNRIVLKLNTAGQPRKNIFLFDNAELLSPVVVAEICRNYGAFHSIAFFSLDPGIQDNLQDIAFTTIKVAALMACDFDLICKSLFPYADTEACALLRMLTDLDLINLYKFRNQVDSTAIISRDDVYNNYLNIYNTHLIEC